MWNGRFFERSELLTHELTLDLCHDLGDCPTLPFNVEMPMMHGLHISDDGEGDDVTDPPSGPSGIPQGFRSKLIIVSSTGIFQRSIRWCHCAKSSDQYVQLLLRAKLFPASFQNPKTTFTFEVLDHFCIDTLECKMAAMNFMSKIGRITNEAFPSQVPVSLTLHLMRFPLLVLGCRTDIGSYYESIDSGRIFTIELELGLFMIVQIILLKVDWHCSALRVHSWISTYPLRSNGRRMTGTQEPQHFLPLILTDICNRWLYRPQLVVDGNMKLVHLIMKRPEDDVSLSDGELFMVKRAPYTMHLENAPERQPVSSN